MSILGWILFGLVVGVVAKLLMPGRDPSGFLMAVNGGDLGLIVFRKLCGPPRVGVRDGS